MAKERIELGPTGRTVAANLRRLRAARDLTLKQMAEDAKELGRTFGVNALSQAEKGLRRLDVDDLVALAAVLNVSPNALLLPVEIDREQPIEVTGAEGNITASRAWAWALGAEPLKGQGDRQRTADYHRQAKPWWVIANWRHGVIDVENEDARTGKIVKNVADYVREETE